MPSRASRPRTRSAPGAQPSCWEIHEGMRNVVSGRLRTIFLVMAALGATALLALGGAPTAAPVRALTLSTPYPAVRVDPGGQVHLPILVQSPNAEKVDLS